MKYKQKYIPNFGLKREYNVQIENFPPQELDNALHNFNTEVCNFVVLIVNS